MPNPTRRAVALAVLAAAIVAGAVALDLAPVAAQSDEQTGRIIARRVADDRIEFGWQPTDASGEAIGPRVLPRARYLPQDAERDRWLSSSPVEVGGAEIGRINARLRDDGRIEFAFTPTDGERIEPPARYFPVDARINRWLRSTEITINAAPTGFVAISAGAAHTCAIRAGSGAIECWGWNEYGQIDAPTGRFSAVAAGRYHTCGLRESGAIECWGWNDEGQADAPTGSFTAVSAGLNHSCGLRDTGAIECWGSNTQHIFRHIEDLDGTVTQTYEEVAVGQADPPDGSFSAVSAGAGRTCAIRVGSGAIECWGMDDGAYPGPYRLADPPPGRFTAVTTGENHACAIRESGAIECWGSGPERDAPTGSFTAVSAGGGWHTCAIRDDGAIQCWGSNWAGETDAPTGSFTAVSASGSVGGGHTCAIRESGEIECWGSNRYGQTDAPAP